MDRLCEVIGSHLAAIDKLREELSCVPVDFVYEREFLYRPYKSPQYQVSYGLERAGRRFSVGTESCPMSVLPVPVSELREDSVVWCLYPVDLARQADLPFVCVVRGGLFSRLATWFV